MPVKVKAKNQSQYMRTTHHHLTKIHHVKKPMNNWKKVLIGLGVMLLIGVICLGLSME